MAQNNKIEILLGNPILSVSSLTIVGTNPALNKIIIV